jgi:hypothetical protein
MHIYIHFMHLHHLLFIHYSLSNPIYAYLSILYIVYSFFIQDPIPVPVYSFIGF